MELRILLILLKHEFNDAIRWAACSAAREVYGLMGQSGLFQPAQLFFQHEFSRIGHELNMNY